MCDPFLFISGVVASHCCWCEVLWPWYGSDVPHCELRIFERAGESGSGDGGGDGAAWGCERSGAEGGVALVLMSVVGASVAAQLLCLDRDLESRHCKERRRGGASCADHLPSGGKDRNWNPGACVSK